MAFAVILREPRLVGRTQNGIREELKAQLQCWPT